MSCGQSKILKTYLDSGVLITAFRVQGETGERARQILMDKDRQFASSVFVRLELLPKADELVTTERTTKPMHRVDKIRVVSIVR